MKPLYSNYVNKGFTKKISPWIFVGLTGVLPSTVMSCTKITSIICQYFKLTLNQLTGRSRKSIYIVPRYMLYHILFNHTGMNKSRIGSEFGRDHSTIINGLNKLRDFMETDEHIFNQLNELEKMMEIPLNKRTARVPEIWRA